MSAESFRFFKMWAIIILFIASVVAAAIHGAISSTTYSDEEIKIAGVEYCMHKKRLDKAEALYNKCASETPQVGLKECRRNAYELSSITAYSTETVELRPGFIDSYNTLYIKANTLLKDGTINKLSCN